MPRKTQARGTSSLDRKTTLPALVQQSLDDNKAEDIVVIDLHGKSSIADSMIIATGRSQRHLASMAEHLAVLLREQGIEDVGIEGVNVGDWVLVDGGDVIVHLFRPEVRRHYSLEKMWGMVVPAEERQMALA